MQLFFINIYFTQRHCSTLHQRKTSPINYLRRSKCKTRNEFINLTIRMVKFGLTNSNISIGRTLFAWFFEPTNWNILNYLLSPSKGRQEHFEQPYIYVSSDYVRFWTRLFYLLSSSCGRKHFEKPYIKQFKNSVVFLALSGPDCFIFYLHYVHRTVRIKTEEAAWVSVTSLSWISPRLYKTRSASCQIAWKSYKSKSANCRTPSVSEKKDYYRTVPFLGSRP